MEDFCIVCSKQNQKLTGYTENIESTPSPQEIVDNFTRIQITPSADEPKICSDCVETLKLIYKFTVSCIEAQKYLQLSLDSHEEDSLHWVDDSKTIDTLDEEKFVCPFCQKKFNSSSNLNNHLQVHSNQAEYHCNHCGKSFKRKNYLSKHIKFVHVVAEVQCGLCSQILQNSTKLEYHLKSHQPDKRYKCQFCEKSFIQSHHLHNHERIHTQEFPFLCSSCGKSFKQECNFKAHLKLHSSDSRIVCKICAEPFTDRHTFLHHVKEHPTKTKLTKTRKLEMTKTRSNVTTKRESGTKYSCNICLKTFKIPSSLIAHTKMHTQDRKHHCEQCTLSFKRAEHLRIHIQRIHLKEKPHKCDLCDKVFSQIGDKNIHQQSHSSAKSHICFCGKSFRLQKALRSHTRLVHTGERKYQCSLCKMDFMTYSALTGHTMKCETSVEDMMEVVKEDLGCRTKQITLIILPIERQQMQAMNATVLFTVPVSQI